MRRPLAVLALVALPGTAQACAVCGAAVDRNNSAFIATTILLSLLPLALIGSAIWWVARHSGGHLAGELAEPKSPVGIPRGSEGGAGT